MLFRSGRLFHPPTLRLPRQPLRPRTRLLPCSVLASFRPSTCERDSRCWKRWRGFSVRQDPLHGRTAHTKCGWYLLGSSLAAALPAERRVLARRGWAGEKSEFFEPLAGESCCCCGTRASHRGSRVQNVIFSRPINLNASNPAAQNHMDRHIQTDRCKNSCEN